jgi:hypothetical protein
LLHLCGILLVSGTVCAAALPELDARLGVIFPAAKARDLLHQCSRSSLKASGTWTPDKNQIAILEKGLVAALAAADGAQNYKRDITHVARQYGGILISGRKLIYVNGFPGRTSDSDWRRHAMLVCDGGPAFFGAEYDPANRTFTGLEFNGMP